MEPEQPNIEQQQRGLARSQRGKVRTGCVTCKARRVKCDEKKPHCRRCIESRSVDVCGGYGPRNLSKRQPDKPSTLSKLLPRTSGSLFYGSGLATGFSKDPDERRYFYLFQQHTSELLSGYFETEFWSSIVPQAAHELPCIRHAVVAISALLKATQTSTRPTLALDSLKQKEAEYKYAISQYSRAISSLKLLLSSKLSDGSYYKIALITAICFIAIENLQGDLPTASRNMAGALSIAIEPKSDYVQCLKNPGGIPDYNAIDNELLTVFADLDMQSTLPSFYGVNCSSRGLPLVLASLPCMPSPEIPTKFPNIGAAKTALIQIHALLTRLHSRSPHHLASKTTSSSEYKELLDQWKTAFAPLFQQAQDIFTASYDSPADPKAYIPFFILSSNHALATIIACTNAGNCSEMFYDNMMPEFQRIINYSEIIVDALCSRSPSIFTFEVGVLPPLYVAAAKCRDPKLRRKAIALMRQCPSQEGVWQGSGSAEVCEWVMEIEEIGAVNGRYSSEKAPPDYAASITEMDRVKWSSVKCELRERRVTATRTAMISVVQGSHRLWERSFTW